MKKFLSVILSLLMFISVSAPSFASESETEEMQRVLLAVKERIGSTDEYDEFYSAVSSSGKSQQYTFSWESDNNRLNVSANSDGVISSYNFYATKGELTVSTRKPTLNKMTSDEAAVKTKELIRALNPDIADDIRIVKNTSAESLFDDGFGFSLQRTQSGIDVVGDTGYVRVNANAEIIESFHLSYTQNLEFDDINTVIDAEMAKNLYKSKIGANLRYNVSPEKAVLEYVPKHTDTYISAIDGNTVNPIEPSYQLYKNEAASDTAAPMSAGGGKYRQLSEAELKNAEELEGLISKDDGETVLRNNTLLAIGNDMELTYFNTYYDSATKSYTYSYEFTAENSSASATVDAADATLKRYSFYNGKYEEVTEDNTALAKSYAEQLATGLYKSDDTLGFRFDKADNGIYSFIRYVNDIACYNNSITLGLNSDNEISYYNLQYNDVEFSSPEGILSETEACDKLFGNGGYKMYYYPSCSSEGLREADRAVLIYDFENHYLVLDAKTGEIKNQDNDEPVVGNYTDIDGHYAEDIIRTLAKFGIGFEESEFKPDSLITQADFITLLTSALVNNESVVIGKAFSDYSYYYDRASYVNIISKDEEAPDAHVSRELAAVYMIRALKLDDVASLEGIYTSEFNDVSTHIGHISILNAMGVLNGHAGMFRPDENLTRADTMIMLYNYLAK